MKKILTIIITAFTVSTGLAQGSSMTVPMSVLNSFTTLYPDIKDVRWDHDEINYEASFKVKNKRMSLLFDENGYVNEVKNELIAFEVPSGIKSLIESRYADWHISKALHVSVNGNGYYEMILDKKSTRKEEGDNKDEGLTLVFDQNGQLVLKVIE